MKNLYLRLFFFTLPLCSFAQLFVKPITTTGSTDEAYVYNKGTVLFVTQDIELKDGSPDQNQGNIYLRDEGQLIQRASNNKFYDNKGSGIVSVYQTGFTNAYDYHYWASPVNDPTSDGTLMDGNRAFNLNVTSSGGGLYDIIDELSSNIANFTPAYNGYTTSDSDPGTSNLFISTAWLYRFVNGSTYSDWFKIASDGNVQPGQGFTMKGLNAAPTTYQYDFRGRPNNGDINVLVNQGNIGLVGNPYPSALDLNRFLIENSGSTAATSCGSPSGHVKTVITGAAYFWDSKDGVNSHYLAEYQGGYGTYTPGMSCDPSAGEYVPATYSMYHGDGTDNEDINNTGTGSVYERRYSPIGQGFFVESFPATPSGSTVTFRNTQRAFVKMSSGMSDFRSHEKNGGKSAQAGNPERSIQDENGAVVMPRIRLKTDINNTYTRINAIIFNERATLGFDAAGDAAQISELSTDINFNIENDDRPIVIDILPWAIDRVIPLKLNTNANTNIFSISVNEINFDTEGVWVFDNTTGDYHDILNNSYDLTLPKGDYTGRFEIVFQNKESLAVEDAETIKDSFAVYQNNAQALLTILNTNRETLREINIFDISGKMITSKLNEEDAERVGISTANWSDGVYIVTLRTNQNIEISKKFSVLNKN